MKPIFKKGEDPYARRKLIDPAVLEAFGGVLPSAEQLGVDEERFYQMSEGEQEKLIKAYCKTMGEAKKLEKE